MCAPTVNLFSRKWLTEAANPPIKTPFALSNAGFLGISASLSISPCNIAVKQPSIF